MRPETARTLNWQLSQKLGLDPSEPHTIHAESWCGCYSEWTRDDTYDISVDGNKVGSSWSWDSITEFVSDMAEEGEPGALDGIAPARITEDSDTEAYQYCGIEYENPYS